MYPFERFTEAAKRTLTQAQREAESAHHAYIGTEHLLLGLCLPDSVSGTILNARGVTADRVRGTIEAVLGRNKRITAQQIIPTSRVKKVIELAFDEARQQQVNHVSTGHLLIGLLVEGEGIAAHVLDDLGVDLGTVRADVRAHPDEEAAELSPRPVVSGLAPSTPMARWMSDATQIAARERQTVSAVHLLLALIESKDEAVLNILGAAGVSDLALGRIKELAVFPQEVSRLDEELRTATVDLQSADPWAKGDAMKHVAELTAQRAAAFAAWRDELTERWKKEDEPKRRRKPKA